jgi:hypothetical protein
MVSNFSFIHIDSLTDFLKQKRDSSAKGLNYDYTVSGAERVSLNNVETSNNNSIISAVPLFLPSYQRT